MVLGQMVTIGATFLHNAVPSSIELSPSKSLPLVSLHCIARLQEGSTVGNKIAAKPIQLGSNSVTKMGMKWCYICNINYHGRRKYDVNYSRGNYLCNCICNY